MRFRTQGIRQSIAFVGPIDGDRSRLLSATSVRRRHRGESAGGHKDQAGGYDQFFEVRSIAR
jgi:hypothetical protein